MTKGNLIIYKTPDWLTAFSTGRDSGVEALGLTLVELALPRQVHSDNVLWMHGAGRPEATDAVITDRPGLCVCVKTADCIPVLLYDTKQRLVAAVHAGWRGTVSRIVQKTIKQMHPLNPNDLHAIIGPGISLDLWEANRFLLEEMGVEDIFVEGTCTRTSMAFYSARRETINTGRNYNGIFIKLKD